MKDKSKSVITLSLFLSIIANCYSFFKDQKIQAEFQEIKNHLQYYKSYSLNSKLDNKFNTDEIQELEKLHENAVEVSRIFKKQGKGVDTKSGLDLILKSKESHCGHNVYIFARKIQDLGYQFRILGIATAVNLNHAFVEVKLKTTGQWYLFDPSNGVYYLNTLSEIQSNPELSNNKIGQASEAYQKYTFPHFFKNIIKINIPPDNLRWYETNYALEAKIINQSDFVDDNPVQNAIDGDPYNTYTVAKENNNPNFFELDLGEARKIYRFTMHWDTESNNTSEFEILANQNGKYIAVFSSQNNIEDDAFTEVILSKPIITEKIKFVAYKAQRQDEFILKEFSVYKY